MPPKREGHGRLHITGIFCSPFACLGNTLTMQCIVLVLHNKRPRLLQISSEEDRAVRGTLAIILTDT